MEAKEQSDQEISLSDLIKIIKDWFQYFLSKKWTILISAFVFSLVFLIYAFFQKKVYTAKLTFVVEEKSSGGMGGLGSIASQFGFDLGGGASGMFSGENIIELMKSRLMVENTLLSPVEIEGKKESLLNRYISFNELDKDWAKNEKLKELKFPLKQKRETYTIQQDSVLGKIYKGLVTEDLSVQKIDKKLGIIKIEFQSKDQLFAKLFCEELAKNVTEFYIQTKTSKSRKNVELLQQRVDSVRSELGVELNSYAVNQDQNQGLIFAAPRVPAAKKELNIKLLTTLYGELVKNLELARLQLDKEEPIIQVIDRPILPLEFEKFGKIKAIIFGGLLGGFLSLLYLGGKRFFAESLNK